MNIENASKLQKYIMADFLGGPKIISLHWIINLNKGLTFFYILTLMYIHNNFSLGCVLYLSLHGSYGFLWLLKDFTFPDRAF